MCCYSNHYIVMTIYLQLAKRQERRTEAKKELAKAEESGYNNCQRKRNNVNFCQTVFVGDIENVEKFQKRLVRTHYNITSWSCYINNTIQVKVTAKHNEEAMKLLALMGVPYIEVCSLSSPLPPSLISPIIYSIGSV